VHDIVLQGAQALTLAADEEAPQHNRHARPDSYARQARYMPVKQLAGAVVLASKVIMLQCIFKAMRSTKHNQQVPEWP
jgi:hypothetical protein